jgi:chloramphenicol-sensitive protein RarD
MSYSLRTGAFAAASAFFIWGFAPLYWRLLVDIHALELLAHRIVWALPLLVLWMTLYKRWRGLGATLNNLKVITALLSSTVLIAVNWGMFIWAVNNNRVLDASLGYFINPLVSVLLGLVFLHERLNRAQVFAVCLATSGVAIMALRFGSLPWVSLALAFSFGFYGLVRKITPVNSVEGLTFETTVLTPIAVGFLFAQNFSGVAALGHISPITDVLLFAAGPITAVPLVLFTVGARSLPLSTLGLLQFIAPTGHFLLAVAVFGESFTISHAVTFCLIWIALCIHMLDLRRRLRGLKEPVLCD